MISNNNNNNKSGNGKRVASLLACMLAMIALVLAYLYSVQEGFTDVSRSNNYAGFEGEESTLDLAEDRPRRQSHNHIFIPNMISDINSIPQFYWVRDMSGKKPVWKQQYYDPRSEL